MKTFFKIKFTRYGWIIIYKNGLDIWDYWRPITDRTGENVRVFAVRKNAIEALKELRAGLYNIDTFNEGAIK